MVTSALAMDDVVKIRCRWHASHGAREVIAMEHLTADRCGIVDVARFSSSPRSPMYSASQVGAPRSGRRSGRAWPPAPAKLCLHAVGGGVALLGRGTSGRGGRSVARRHTSGERCRRTGAFTGLGIERARVCRQIAYLDRRFDRHPLGGSAAGRRCVRPVARLGQRPSADRVCGLALRLRTNPSVAGVRPASAHEPRVRKLPARNSSVICGSSSGSRARASAPSPTGGPQ